MLALPGKVLISVFINSTQHTFGCYLTFLPTKQQMTVQRFFRFMKHKILIPVLIAGLLAAFFSFKYTGSPDNQGGDDYKQTVLQSVMSAIQQVHFAPRQPDDTFSSRVYHRVLDQLDFDKKFFTQKEINQLSKYEFILDDDLAKNTVAFFNDVNALFNKGIDRAEGYYKEILDKPFTYTANDSIQLDGEKLNYAPNEAALRDRWQKFLKYRALVRYTELKKAQEKPAKGAAKTASADEDEDAGDEEEGSTPVAAPAKPMTPAEMEAEARKSVRKNQEYFFRRLRKVDDDKRFALVVNAITNTEDPHTDFLPPEDKKRFDEQMSGSFFGIGAQLKDEDGKIKIVSIIAGAPAWKQGELKAGDEILKVGQGNAEPEDVQGYDLEDVVKKIRGPEGSTVKLTVKKLDGAQKIIAITRGRVSIEETYAKSAIINTKGGPVGYIYLPEFYADFQQANGRRSAVDVAIEIQKLKRAGVAGIILDLRYNGGGSLNDVVEMGGDFIDRGPIVQVKSSRSNPVVLRDQENGELWDGPLVIMVNQGSASASEILAAAMQDYKRAVIVGSTTFGKGTVQKVIPLDRMNDPVGSLLAGEGARAMGSLKITVQKFYRINGGSTQLRGVTPDIILPDLYQYIDIGERRDKAALKWDEIPAATYTPWRDPVNIKSLAAASKKRVAANPSFQLISANAQKMKQRSEHQVYSLNEVAYRKQIEETNADSKKLKDLQEKATPFSITNLKEDLQQVNLDETTKEKNKKWIKDLQKDIYITETVNIVLDMLHMSAMNTGQVPVSE